MTEDTSSAARAGPYSGSSGRQVNQYDKILRDNRAPRRLRTRRSVSKQLRRSPMEAFLPGLIKNLLDIHAVYTEELPDDVQHTKERKPDVLKRVTDNSGRSFVLQIEFQSTDEPDMAFRMAEYYIMLLRCYRIPVQQYVIYLGEGAPRMSDHIVSEQLQFNYRLIALSAIDYHIFLKAENPEEKMLGILANFGDHDSLEAAASIVKEVFDASDGDLSKARYLQQLRILGNLRNLQCEINTIMESVAKWWKIERDPFYWRGHKEGIEKGQEIKTLEVVKSLLLKTTHTVPEIASLVNVPESFVLQVKASLQP